MRPTLAAPCHSRARPWDELEANTGASWVTVAKRLQWPNDTNFLTGECSLLARDLVSNAPRYVRLLIPFFFASCLGLILSD